MVHIRFQKLNIKSVANSSSVSTGENVQWGWSYRSKANQGFGRVSGSGNTIAGSKHTVSDRDAVDTVEAFAEEEGSASDP
jgi:hypothetical protein